jgi:hypothetical protein
MGRGYVLRPVHPDRGTLPETWIVFVEWEERRIGLAARGIMTCYVTQIINICSSL